MNGEPYYFTLGVPDFERGKAFYAALFDWVITDEGHIADLALSGGIAPAENGLGPRIYLSCADVAAGIARLRELGGTSGEPVIARSGDYAECIDDQGSSFCIGSIHPEMEAEQIAGLDLYPSPSAELGYLTLGAPDVDRAATFFDGLFGWHADDATAGSVDEGARYRHVSNTTLPLGFVDHDLDRRLALYFKVADVAARAGDVERLGGEVDAVVESESGASASCRDDQGTSFSLWQPAAGY